MPICLRSWLALLLLSATTSCTWSAYSYRSWNSHAVVGVEGHEETKSIEFDVDPRASTLEFGVRVRAIAGTMRWTLFDQAGRRAASGSCADGRFRDDLQLEAAAGTWRLRYDAKVFSGDFSFTLDAHSDSPPG